MKIAYLGKIQLTDVDFSYMKEARRMADITYILELNPRFMNGPALSVQRLYPRSGIFRAVDVYPEFRRYADVIDLDKFYVVNTTGRLWVLKSFWTNILLLFFLLRQHFEAIHLVWPPNIYEFVLYFLRRKMLLTVHDPFPHTSLDTFIVRLRRKVAFRLIPKLVILNKAQRNDFLSFYRLKPERVIDSRLGCYTFLQTVKPDESSVPKGRYILFSGKISRYKGVDYLLKAMQKVHSKHPDVLLVVAGAGDFHFDVDVFKALDYIEFRNYYVSEEEMVALVRHAEFLVCPYTDATQSGVVMTSFAFDVPVLATRVGGLPEMLGEGRYGLLVEPCSVDALADGLDSLLADKKHLESYTRNIAADYETGDKSWRQIAKSMLQELVG